MTDTQIKDYLKKHRIDSEEQLAKHIEELKRGTKPNNEIIFPLVDLLLNEKSVLNSFFRENYKERGETVYVRTITPFFLDEMLGKCSTQCFCDGSCKKPQEKKLGGYIKPNVYVNSTRHKAREEGNFHKEIVGDLEGVNKPKGVEVSLKELKENTINNVELGLDIADILGITLCDNRDYIYKLIEKKISAKKDKIKTAKLHTYPLTPEECFKDDVITNSSRGEKETMEYLQGVKETEGKLYYELSWEFIEEMAKRMANNKSNKYPLFNWKKNIDVEDLKQAINRHHIEVMKGNYKDGDELLGHVVSYACNSMMLWEQLNKS